MPLIDATKFQSTHPHGVRRICRYRYRSSWSVSIHAPTRGATGGSCAAYSSPPGFNPRTHTGCDYWPAIQRFYSFMVSIHAPTRGATMRNLSRRNTFSVSIHAPTRGATCLTSSTPPFMSSFNPRTHTGCDQTWDTVLVRHYVSIHAPTRGATKCQLRLTPHSEFQSTHPHGVRPVLKKTVLFLLNRFNPRTHTGCDLRH